MMDDGQKATRKAQVSFTIENRWWNREAVGLMSMQLICLMWLIHDATVKLATNGLTKKHEYENVVSQRFCILYIVEDNISFELLDSIFYFKKTSVQWCSMQF